MKKQQHDYFDIMGAYSQLMYNGGIGSLMNAMCVHSDAIRKEKRYTNVPILVISAHAENHLKLMEDEAIQGFITKPFQDNDLIVQVNYLLEN